MPSYLRYSAGFTACDTDAEPLNLQPAYKYWRRKNITPTCAPTRIPSRNAHYASYRFSDYDQSYSMAYRFAGLPDSVDICWLEQLPDAVDPLAYKEMWEMRNKKGTWLVMPPIMPIIED